MKRFLMMLATILFLVVGCGDDNVCAPQNHTHEPPPCEDDCDDDDNGDDDDDDDEDDEDD
jgi:hypothetical protein